MDRQIERATEDRNDVSQNGDGKLDRTSGMTNYFADDDVPAVNPTVVLISPNETSLKSLRRSMEAERATVVKEFTAYPTYTQLEALVEADCDAIIVEIDTDIELALDVIETICARKPIATAMVYSSEAASERMVRSMRAGAREFLTGATGKTVLQDALLRAAARRLEQTTKRTSGKTMVFWGTKGGNGVTTLATNFAIALRAETGAEVALLDLNPRLGDVAALLNVTPRFTVADALENARRLDQHFVSTLVTEHKSGIAVLAAPDAYSPSLPIEGRTIGKLVEVVRNIYPYVVIDAGRDLGLGAEPLLQMADVIYLVTQMDLMSLRNAQRYVSYIKGFSQQQIELVVNRSDPRKSEFDDERVAKVLGLAPKWKVPNDFAAARRSANEGNPLVLQKSAIANAYRAMARAASGKQATPERRRGLGIFGM